MEYIYLEVGPQLGLLKEKRPRRYPGRNHLLIYAEQNWKDWHLYPRPGTRVTDWGLLLSNIFTTARIGEYVESTNRKGSGRGLKYKDLRCICLWHEDRKPELAIMLTKDAKKFTNKPDSKRPKSSLAEGRKPDCLCFNSLLPTLTQLLRIKAFRDHHTMEELYDIVPPDNAVTCPVPWRQGLLETPFWLNQSITKDACIDTAAAVHGRFMRLGVRGGMARPPTIHDWRARSMFQIDKHYSESDRMGSAAQRNAATDRNNYQPSESRVDGQATFLGNERRDIVAAAFLEMGIPYNPNLSQQLPAEEMHNSKTATSAPPILN